MPIEMLVEISIELPVEPEGAPLPAGTRGAKGSHASNEIFPRGLSY